MLRNILLYILLISLATSGAITGCGGKVILSDDAVRIRNIDNFVRELRGLYEQRDEHVLDMFSQGYLAEEKESRSTILHDLERFNSISLSLFIDRIEINDKDASISIHWNGVWKDARKTYREGGSMVLLTSIVDTIKIIAIKGDSPFGISRMLKD